MATKGLHRSLETEFKKGQSPWNKNKEYQIGQGRYIRTEEIRKKQSSSHKDKPTWNKGICGSKSHSWMGGKATLTERIRISERYKKWRSDVFKRDGWTCQTCGLRGHGNDIEAHHIIPMNKILKKASIRDLNIDDKYILAMSLTELFDVSNGVTLCKNCHILTYKTKEKKMKKQFLSFALATLLLFGITGLASAANIPTGADPQNQPEVWTMEVYNNYTSALTSGTVVVWDMSSDSTDASYAYRTAWVTTTTSNDSIKVAGVVVSNSIPAGGVGAIAIRGPVYTLTADSTDAVTASQCIGTANGVRGQCGEYATSNNTGILGWCIYASPVALAYGGDGSTEFDGKDGQMMPMFIDPHVAD